MTLNRLLQSTLVAITLALMVACGSSPTAPTSGAAGTGAVTLLEPATVAWSAPAAGSTCAAGSASDFIWTDTINETAGVQVTLTSVVVTIDGAASAPSTISKTITAKGQITLSREQCFPTTIGHVAASQYTGTDANGHAVTTSATVTLAGKPSPAISQPQISELANAIAVASGPLLSSVLGQVFGLQAAGTTTIDTTLPCHDSGTARTFGPATLTLDAAGTSGSVALDMSLVYAKCTNGSRVLDGGPLEIKGQMNVVNSDIQNPIKFTITGSHTFTVDGTNGSVSFSCNNSLTVDLNALTLGPLVAVGNASLQYPTGQNPTTAPCQTFADAFDLSSL